MRIDPLHDLATAHPIMMMEEVAELQAEYIALHDQAREIEAYLAEICRARAEGRMADAVEMIDRQAAFLIRAGMMRRRSETTGVKQ